MLLGRSFEYTVSSQAMVADNWIRTTGGEEDEVHVGYELQVAGCKLQVTSYEVMGYEFRVTS